MKCSWDLQKLRKWLDRVWRLLIETKDKLSDENDHKLDYSYNFMVKKVSEDIESLNLNTAISQMMIFINDCYKEEKLYKEYAVNFTQILSCFAPFIGNEMYEILTGKNDLAYRPWPEYDESKLVLDTIEIVVQINGKVRAKFMDRPGLSNEEILEKALAQENIKKFTDDKEIKKYFVIKGKIINIVI